MRTLGGSADGVDILFFDIARHDWATAGTCGATARRPRPGLTTTPSGARCMGGGRGGGRRSVAPRALRRGPTCAQVRSRRVACNRVDDPRPQRDRQRVPHAVEDQEFRARDGARAVSRPQASGTSGSARPWITSVGTSMSRRLHAGCPTSTAASWRATPAGSMPRGSGRRVRRRVHRRPRTRAAQHLPGPQVVRQVDGRVRRGRCPEEHRHRLGGWRRQVGAPVVDMIEVSAQPLLGCLMAMICAIAPPIDAPTTCAVPMPSASISPIVSEAMSSSRWAR